MTVDQCVVQSRPPRQLKQAFANVVTAGQKSSTVINEARAYANKVLSTADADAVGRINGAETERTRLVQSVTSDADNFRRLLPKYLDNPDLFRQQRLVETMGRVLTNASEKIYLSERADGKPRELRLLLNREPPKPKTEDSDDEKAERLANIGLKAAKGYVTDGKTEDAKEECEKIIKKYPKTKAAEEAKKLLQKLS